MAVVHTDRYWLSQDPHFLHQVQAAWLTAAVAIQTESPTTTPFHRERQRYITQSIASPQALANAMTLVAACVATDSNVIGDATVGGTVKLTDGTTAATGGLLVTDAHVDAAISGQFNTYFMTPDN